MVSFVPSKYCLGCWVQPKLFCCYPCSAVLLQSSLLSFFCFFSKRIFQPWNELQLSLILCNLWTYLNLYLIIQIWRSFCMFFSIIIYVAQLCKHDPWRLTSYHFLWPISDDCCVTFYKWCLRVFQVVSFIVECVEGHFLFQFCLSSEWQKL